MAFDFVALCNYSARTFTSPPPKQREREITKMHDKPLRYAQSNFRCGKRNFTLFYSCKSKEKRIFDNKMEMIRLLRLIGPYYSSNLLDNMQYAVKSGREKKKKTLNEANKRNVRTQVFNLHKYIYVCVYALAATQSAMLLHVFCI